jgi:hypothetical protein
MKKITVHGAVTDNAGDRHPAGATLTVDDKPHAGCITAERAAQLVAINSATEIAEKAGKAGATAD